MKLALFTGTFDPFHRGHAAQLVRAHAAQPFDQVIVAPIKFNSNKPNATAWEHRAAMAGLTLRSQELPFAWRIEPIENISVANIRAFRAEHMSAERPLRIVGTDALIEFVEDNTYWPMLSEFDFVVVSRPAVDDFELHKALAGLPEYVKDKLNLALVPMKVQLDDISSSNMRGDVVSNAHHLANDVMLYIGQHGLYPASRWK